LNKALAEFTKLLNQHFVASGNQIVLHDDKNDKYDEFDTLRERGRNHFVLTATITWRREKQKSK